MEVPGDGNTTGGRGVERLAEQTPLHAESALNQRRCRPSLVAQPLDLEKENRSKNHGHLTNGTGETTAMSPGTSSTRR